MRTVEAGDQLMVDVDAGGGGDAERFDTFYRERFGPMVKLAGLITQSPDVARDLVQDAFVRVHRRFDRLENPSAYLRAAVVNACRSWQRRALLERRTAAAQPPGSAASLDASEMADALRRLPFRQRAALVLRFYGGFTEVEIAESLGCRPGTVGPLIHRGLAALREVIER